MGGAVCACHDDAKSSEVEETTPDEQPMGGIAALSQPKAGGKTEEFNVTVRKQGPDERLGMDVKHLGDRLEVTRIFPEGAVIRMNQASPKTALKLGDVILKVNSMQ